MLHSLGDNTVVRYAAAWHKTSCSIRAEFCRMPNAGGGLPVSVVPLIGGVVLPEGPFSSVV